MTPGAPAPCARPRWVTLAPPSGPLEVCLIEFPPAAPGPQDFAAAGVDWNAALARSVDKRRAEFLHGRLAARAALAAIGRHGWQVGVGPAREPQWPHDVVGSISHVEGVAAAAAAPRARVQALGLDLEHVVGHDARDGLLALALDEDELACLAAASGPLSLEARLTIAFSAKESFFKAAYPSVGRYFDFSAAKVTAFDTARACIALVVREPLSEEFPSGRRCELCFAVLDGRLVLTAMADGAGWGPRSGDAPAPGPHAPCGMREAALNLR